MSSSCLFQYVQLHFSISLAQKFTTAPVRALALPLLLVHSSDSAQREWPLSKDHMQLIGEVNHFYNSVFIIVVYHSFLNTSQMVSLCCRPGLFVLRMLVIACQFCMSCRLLRIDARHNKIHKLDHLKYRSLCWAVWIEKLRCTARAAQHGGHLAGQTGLVDAWTCSFLDSVV